MLNLAHSIKNVLDLAIYNGHIVFCQINKERACLIESWVLVENIKWGYRHFETRQFDTRQN